MNRHWWPGRVYKTARHRRFWPFFAGLFIVSGAMTGLQLSASLALLTVYDSVVRSRSVGALAVLLGLALGLYLLFTLLDFLRSRLLSRAGLDFAQDLERRVLATSLPGGLQRIERLADVERMARFVAHAGPSAFFDALWLPGWLTAAVLLHPALGFFLSVGALLLIGLAAADRGAAGKASLGIVQTQRRRLALAERMLRPDQVCDNLCRVRWRKMSRLHYGLISHAAERAHAFRAVGKGLRLMLQSIGVGLATVLAIHGCISAGGLLASSLIVGRTFSSLDAALVHWRSFIAARESYLRLLPFCPGAG